MLHRAKTGVRTTESPSDGLHLSAQVIFPRVVNAVSPNAPCCSDQLPQFVLPCDQMFEMLYDFVDGNRWQIRSIYCEFRGCDSLQSLPVSGPQVCDGGWPQY